MAKSIPDILVGVIVGLLATYFFIADNEKLLNMASSHVSDEFREKTTRVYRQLVQVVGGYFKAQFKIMGVIYVIIFIGLLILRVRYAWLIAFGIAFLDMLPVFGNTFLYVHRLSERWGTWNDYCYSNWYDSDQPVQSRSI